MNLSKAFYHHIAESNWINLFVIIPALVYAVYYVYAKGEAEKQEIRKALEVEKQNKAYLEESHQIAIKDLYERVSKIDKNRQAIKELKEGDTFTFRHGLIK